MLKKNLSKSALVVALLTTTVIWRGTTAYAEDPNQAFTLDPMIVTAQRTETRDLDTPATTNIITEQNIKEAGYKNVFDAIEHQVGLTSTGYGDAGQDFGFSSGRTVIRGYDRGTLVMVDGIPMNLKNYNSLDGIPIDMVQQIEIIKGAAGTLYGSEAMGGVVNVITKRPGGKTQVKVKGTVGNYYKDYGVTYAGEKLIVTASKEYSNKLTHSNAYPEGSSTDWWVGKGQKNRAGISAALTDEIGFTFIYQDGNITRGSNNDANEDTRGRWRNYYEQEIFNAQVQDTITLNKKGDFWLTPSVRYNRSKILGRSDRYDEKNDPQNVKWFHQQDEQTDDKVTWQLALKKQFNDHFTLRATGGTYYRLLNMYEIAGDGAGIWPMPNVDGTDSVFPMPEEGKQWDVSAIWDGKALGADTAKFQLTYFGRDSENLLQLMSRNFFFFYTNAAKAKVNGLEIQADMSWQKWDVNLQATYTKPKDVFYDMTKLPGYDSNTIAGSLTYQPQWEGTARLTYRPDTNWSLFTQLRYVDWMVTDPIPLTTGAVKRQSSLTTMDVGVKYKFNKSLQLAVGCNDVLNKANDMYLNMYGNGEIRNIQYPIQGRTYYATLQYTY